MTVTNQAIDRGFSGLPIPVRLVCGRACRTDIAMGDMQDARLFCNPICHVARRGWCISARLIPFARISARISASTAQSKAMICNAPFHHWTFNGDGQVTDIPYTKRDPAGASNAQCQPNWPVQEADGVIYVWFHPEQSRAYVGDRDVCQHCADGRMGSGREPMTGSSTSHVQEITENGQDYAHFNAVHGVQGPSEGEFALDGWGRRNKVTAQMVTPRGPMTGIIDVNAMGPGQSSG